MSCSACNGKCPHPEACQLPIAEATKPPTLAFLAENAVRLSRNRWIVISLGSAIGAGLLTWGLTYA